MADAPAPARGGGPVGAITRKAGPLPVWAWAALLLVGYLAYRHFKGTSGSSSSTSGTGADTSQTDQNTYVPGFDAASGIGGGIGNTGLPSTVNNYYYGDQATGQANGGGTSPGATGTPPPSGGGQPPPSGNPAPGGRLPTGSVSVPTGIFASPTPILPPAPFSRGGAPVPY